MSNSSFTPKDIIASREKHEGSRLMSASMEKMRGNKNSGTPTSYIPITFKNVAGKQQYLSLKFVRQLITSNAKLPAKTTLDTARYLTVSYRKLKLDDLKDTEYPEDKKEGLLSSNEEFVKALDIIAEEYITCVKEDVLKHKAKGFSVGNRKITNFKQDRRKPNDDEEGDEEDGKVAMEPIYRIRLPIDQESKKVGRKMEKGHMYIVFDMRKSEAEAKLTGKPKRDVIAKVMYKGKPIDLTLSNAKHFVSFMSLTSGIINFESICLSSQGISFLCNYRALHVWRHKTMKRESIGDEERDDMAEYGYKNADGEEEDLDVNVDEPEEEEQEPESKPNGKTNGKPNGKTNSKSNSKPTGKPVGKAAAKALKVDDDEEQVLEDDAAEEPDENNMDEPEETNADSTGDQEQPKATTKPAPKNDDSNAENEDDGEDGADADDGDGDGDDGADGDADDSSSAKPAAKPTKPAAKPVAKPLAKGASLKAAPKKGK